MSTKKILGSIEDFYMRARFNGRYRKRIQRRCDADH